MYQKQKHNQSGPLVRAKSTVMTTQDLRLVKDVFVGEFCLQAAQGRKPGLCFDMGVYSASKVIGVTLGEAFEVIRNLKGTRSDATFYLDGVKRIGVLVWAPLDSKPYAV